MEEGRSIIAIKSSHANQREEEQNMAFKIPTMH